LTAATDTFSSKAFSTAKAAQDPLDFVDKIHHDIYPAIDPKGKLSGAAEGKLIILTGGGKGIGDVRFDWYHLTITPLPCLLHTLERRESCLRHGQEQI
jgi:hypothetical protein